MINEILRAQFIRKSEHCTANNCPLINICLTLNDKQASMSEAEKLHERLGVRLSYTETDATTGDLLKIISTCQRKAVVGSTFCGEAIVEPAPTSYPALMWALNFVNQRLK